MHTSLRNQILCAIFTALIAIGAFIRIPVPVVPFTLQFLFTTLAGVLLGARLGALSVVIYIVLGLMGVPVLRRAEAPVIFSSPASVTCRALPWALTFPVILRKRKADPLLKTYYWVTR